MMDIANSFRDNLLVLAATLVCSASLFTACSKVEIKKKDKKSFGKVESAFLKDTTDVYDISFQTEKSIKVKLEVDTVPPLKFATEQKILLQPKSFLTRCVALHAETIDSSHSFRNASCFAVWNQCSPLGIMVTWH